VEAVAAAWRAPLYGLRRMAVIPSDRTESISYHMVSSGYFAVFRIPLLRGRLFTQAEAASEAPVVVVGEAAARRLWPGRTPLAKPCRFRYPPSVRIPTGLGCRGSVPQQSSA
jgi:hypothetical protein